MKFHFVEAMAKTIERAQDRRIFVGVEAELHRLRLAQCGAEHRQLAFRPTRLLALDRLAQHRVAGEQIIGLERRRLVANLEHAEGLPEGSRSYCNSRIKETAPPAPAP